MVWTCGASSHRAHHPKIYWIVSVHRLMAVLIAELYGQVFGSPGTGLVRHTIYWLYPSWNHITILGSNVMLYTWYMKQLHLKKCLDKRGKSQQTECPLSLLRFNGLCSNPSRLWNNHKGLRCQRRNCGAAPICMDSIICQLFSLQVAQDNLLRLLELTGTQGFLHLLWPQQTNEWMVHFVQINVNT